VVNYVLGRPDEVVWPYFWQLLPAAPSCTPQPASPTAPSAPTVLSCADTLDPKQGEQTRLGTPSLPTYQTTRLPDYQHAVNFTITCLATLNQTHSG
jgi:hypothetical protein